MNTYDLIAKQFSVTRVFTWKWTDDFINLINNNDNNNNNNVPLILDIGCGNGRNLNYNKYLHGIDSSIEQIKLSNNKNVLHSTMTSIPFRNNIYDAILSIASFHHLDNIDDRRKTLSEMKRVLNVSGKSLLSVWSINQPKKTRRKFEKYGDTIVNFNGIPRYYYIFNINEITNLIKEYFIIDKYFWDCGNEIFILSNY